MAIYLSQPIIDEVVRFVEEDSRYEDSVKAMAAGILTYYFPIANGFLVVPEQNRGDQFPDFIIFRIQRRFPGDRSVVDHTVTEAKKSDDSIPASLEQLQNALEHSNTGFRRCWAILVHGATFYFYEYHESLPPNNRLLPWAPPGRPQGQNAFHARQNSVEIDWMLRHMAQNDTPPAR
ncbi:hypothetical protein M752DRAFT_279533 [Aspergillus phoenicis ATCC 13157]|uniref:Uncharacterized protein n=1 Tax=Aspergillus phoenicis ATCC 13157 TaxID=1353007 RepID=A0A370P7M7_ASPPH|nr:hypothetical protein M752DRAFT_279533 [Aspergillus phoenicis ATCC 13157]GLA30358.1 hypothetical protein AnigIFM63326_008564 [Aspergillus niger]